MRGSTRWWLGLLLVGIPAVFFVPGLGLFEPSRPATLARETAADGTWLYRVRPGEVLSKIAERELGTHRRYEEILRLNPGLKPRALRPGTVLRMPPRERSASETSHATGAPRAPAPPGVGGLLLSVVALLGLLVLVVFAAHRMEQRA
jgi:hypothetical protein